MIENIYDWNEKLQLGGGDILPIHTAVDIITERKQKDWDACGWNLRKIEDRYGTYDNPTYDGLPCPDKAMLYRTVSFEQGEDTFTYNVNAFAQFNVFGYPDSSSGEAAGSGTVTNVSFGGVVTFGFVTGECQSKLNDEDWYPSAGDESAVYLQHAATCGGEPTNYPASVSMRMFRYRMAPYSYFTGSYFNVQWDEVFYPRAWLAWKPKKNAHDSWKAADEYWRSADPSTRGPRPTQPEHPGAEPARPYIMTSREYTYDGGTERRSEWFTVSRPSKEGYVYLRNVRVISYRSPWGSKPWFSGERWSP